MMLAFLCHNVYFNVLQKLMLTWFLFSCQVVSFDYFLLHSVKYASIRVFSILVTENPYTDLFYGVSERNVFLFLELPGQFILTVNFDSKLYDFRRLQVIVRTFWESFCFRKGYRPTKSDNMIFFWMSFYTKLFFTVLFKTLPPRKLQ